LAANGSIILESADVHAGYGELRILRGVYFTLEAGTITAVIGANGAGKSTLLKTIFGIVKIDRGTLTFLGQDVTALSPTQRLERGIALVPQGRCNFPLMKVEENLEMAAYRRRDRQIKHDIERLCAAFPVLGRKRAFRAGDLSGGEQQQLEMAMALMQSPKLALIDEPSLGLSAAMQQIVFETIKELRDQGTTVLMVEQNAVQALRISDRAIVLELGRVGASGSGVEMLEDPEVRRAYLGIRT
jgi:ABC-type branched-subunit amino acid transport system ATPase component